MIKAIESSIQSKFNIWQTWGSYCAIVINELLLLIEDLRNWDEHNIYHITTQFHAFSTLKRYAYLFLCNQSYIERYFTSTVIKLYYEYGNYVVSYQQYEYIFQELKHTSKIFIVQQKLTNNIEIARQVLSIINSLFWILSSTSYNYWLYSKSFAMIMLKIVEL